MWTASIVFFCLWIGTTTSKHSIPKVLEELNDLLFPNRTSHSHPHSHPYHKYSNNRTSSFRRLATDYTGKVPCTVCQGLQYCPILNGYLIHEVYYPNNLNYLQTCKVIDALGARLSPLVFGSGRTFRDTTQCRGKKKTHFSK
jgi:hypothetical protein